MTRRPTTSDNYVTSFYASRSCFDGDRVVLHPDESRHAIKVLRLQPGDEIVVVDGEGGWYRVTLTAVGKNRAEGEVVEVRREVGEPGYTLSIGLAMLHRRERYETFLEKAVELGVSKILPLRTARSGTKWRADRADRILIAAMKQCGRSRLPVVAEPIDLATLTADPGEAGYICHGPGTSHGMLVDALVATSLQRLQILVGPEGGFTDEEVQAGVDRGFELVSLGGRRLRAETAAIAAAAAVMMRFNER